MIKKLVEAGVHFGHLMSRWCPKMKPYIWGHRNRVHLIDVSKTARQLEKAVQFLESITAQGKQVLWIGTKKAAQESIVIAAKNSGMPYVNHRWIGGTLSNFSQVKKSITRLVYHEEIIEKAEKFPHYTKKELNVFQKIAGRLEKNVDGIRTLRWPIGAVIIVDVRKEMAALKEAVAMEVPVVALVDTNGDPSLVDYVIPANDDAAKSISFILSHLQQAVETGVALYKQGEVKKVETESNKKKTPEDAAQETEATGAKKRSAVKKDAVKSLTAESSAEKVQEGADEESNLTVLSIPVPPVDESAILDLMKDDEDEDL